MQAIHVEEFGEAAALKLVDLPTPEPGPLEVLVRVEAAGLNYVDIYHRRGWYPMATPFVPGVEGAGVVQKVGDRVTEMRPGDRVAFASPHTYAQYALVPAAKAVPVPAEVTTEQAAAILLQGMTAHFLCHSTFPVKQGDTALIHAAAGGVGLLLVQMVKLLGGRVIGTASTPEKIALAKAAGADEMIPYTETDFGAEVKRLTQGAGVEVVYDSVGKMTFDGSLNSLKPRGYMVLYGQASGPVPPMDPQILNQKGSLFLTRPSLGHYTLTREELLQRAGDLFNWLQSGRLTLRIDRSFPLAQAADAHQYMENRMTKGKVVLIP